MKLNIYEAKITGKAYLAITVMAESLEEAIADIIKSEGVTRKEITSIKEK